MSRKPTAQVQKARVQRTESQKSSDVPEKEKAQVAEEAPNKGWSFLVGIFICIGIMIVFVLLFNH